MEDYILDTNIIIAMLLGKHTYSTIMDCETKYYIIDYVLDELINKSDEIAEK